MFAFLRLEASFGVFDFGLGTSDKTFELFDLVGAILRDSPLDSGTGGGSNSAA